MYNNQISLELLTENGNRITEFNHKGLNYVEGRKGSKYKIKITNHSFKRVKAIISVDGLDILTGKRASTNAGGYVIPAYSSEVLDGWRISNQQVREFFFTSKNNTYNAKTGSDTNNLGVIGVIAYQEYTAPAYVGYVNMFPDTMYYGSTGSIGSGWNAGSSQFMNCTLANSSSPAREVKTSVKRFSARSASVGTGMGEIKNSKVENVYTSWESTPLSTCLLYYKTRKELEQMGIVVAQVKPQPLPSAFSGYCQQV